MRSIRYRIEMDDEEGYLIYNAETSWNTMPTEDNLKRPSIRVTNESGGELTPDIIEYIKLDDIGGVSPDFAANYIRILQGKISVWVLAVVQISRLGVSLAFFNRQTCKEENLHIEWPPHLVIRFEVSREDGGADTYALQMSAAENAYVQNYLSVTEYDDRGQRSRELRFTPAALTEFAETDEGWSYVYVTEYR